MLDSAAVPRVLFASKDRDEAHVELVAVLKEGKHPLAECRELHNEDAPYQVWDGPARPPDWQDMRIQDPFPAAEPEITDDLLDRLAQKLLERMAEKK